MIVLSMSGSDDVAQKEEYRALKLLPYCTEQLVTQRAGDSGTRNKAREDADMDRVTGVCSLLKVRSYSQMLIAVLLALVVVLPAASPFTERASAYTCTVYVYAPRDYGTYAYVDAEASCPAPYEYKTLSVCLIKQGVGVISCGYDSEYQTNYYAGTSGCYGSGYYYTRANFTNQPARYSHSVYITC